MQESSLQKLMNDYGKRQVPSPSEELHWAGLVRRWLDHPDGPDGAPLAIQRAGRRAKNRLVEGNVRWVIAIAKKHCCSHFSEDRMMDAIQWGVLGLIKAIERFDHTRGYKLSTFSYFWILQNIQRGEENRNTIRIPDGVTLEFRKIDRAITELSEKGLTPTKERLAEITKIPLNRLQMRLKAMPLRSLVSLDAPHGDSEDTNLIDLIPDPRELLDQDVERQAMKDWLDANINTLPTRQRLVLTSLRDGQERKEAARQLGISTSGLSLREIAAIERLRKRMEHHQPLAA